MSQVVHADGSAERFAYNADGDVVSQTTRAGQLTTYAYDALHRRISRTSQASGVTTTYGYDLVGRLLSVATPAVAGNLASGTWTFSFDTAGRPTGETGPDGKHVGFAWDAAGNRIGLTFPDGVVATASYTQLEQLNQVKLGNIVAWTDTYDGLGRLGARVTGSEGAEWHELRPGRLPLRPREPALLRRRPRLRPAPGMVRHQALKSHPALDHAVDRRLLQVDDVESAFGATPSGISSKARPPSLSAARLRYGPTARHAAP